MNFLTWAFSLPKIKKCVGILDVYNNGVVKSINFYGEITIIWVEYKKNCRAFLAVYF
jgi:hypothetical protein